MTCDQLCVAAVMHAGVRWQVPGLLACVPVPLSALCAWLGFQSESRVNMLGFKVLKRVGVGQHTIVRPLLGLVLERGLVSSTSEGG